MKTDQLEYDLPRELIATRPVEPRDSARMLVYHRRRDVVEHRRVRDLCDLLRPGDLMIFNNTAVVPARFRARRADTGGRVDGLFLEARPTPAGEEWEMMLSAGGRLAAGVVIDLLDHAGEPSVHRVWLTEPARPVFRGVLESRSTTEQVLNEIGLTPLPPYILRARDHRTEEDDGEFDDALDRRWYQTVYADFDRRRSVAAPTAGLHFTPELLKRLEKTGVERRNITLHVGPGTFQPISTDTLEAHRMHEEAFEIDPDLFARIESVRAAGGRVIAVGTTTVRALESIDRARALAAPPGSPITGRTDLMIAPPYQFRWIDGLMTNFHLPRSTLLALVAAVVGLDRLLALYHEAVAQRYRFYSYGDAMLILP